MLTEVDEVVDNCGGGARHVADEQALHDPVRVPVVALAEPTWRPSGPMVRLTACERISERQFHHSTPGYDEQRVVRSQERVSLRVGVDVRLDNSTPESGQSSTDAQHTGSRTCTCRHRLGHMLCTLLAKALSVALGIAERKGGWGDQSAGVHGRKSVPAGAKCWRTKLAIVVGV